MSNKDDPDRDKARPADAGQPKKPHATIDLKATEVASKDAGTAATSAGPDKPKDATAAGASAPGIRPADAAASAKAENDKTGAGKTDASYGAKIDERKPVATSTSSAATASAAQQRGGFGSFLSHLAAGVVGGFLALLGGEQIVQHLGLPGDLLPGQQSTAVLQQRLAALEALSRGGAPAGELAQKLAQNEGRLARLEEQSKTLPQLSEAASRLAAETRSMQERIGQAGAGTGDAAARIAKLEDMLATLSAAAQGEQPGRLPQLTALTVRIKELEAAIATQTAALRRDLTQAVETRAAQVGEAGEVARAATQRIDRDLAAVKTDTATLTQRVEVLKADGDRAGQTLRVVQQETGAVRSALDGLKGDVDNSLKTVARPNDVSAALAPLTAKLASLEQGLQGVVKGEADRRTNAERIVLSLELGSLKRVLDRGQRYEAELAEVKKAAGSMVDLAPLEKFKTQGVPTIADLSREFRGVANAVLVADGEPVDGNVVDRLLAGAKSIVRVRKVEHRPGDKSAEAVVARMETALKDGRLGAVIEEARTLPPRSSVAAQDWLEKVEARNSVDRALAAIEARLKASLGGAAAGAPAGGKTQN